MHPLFSRFYYAYKVRPAGRFGQGRFYDQNFLIQ